MDAYSPVTMDDKTTGSSRSQSSHVRLEKLLYQMEHGKRSLSAFRLSLQLEELVERWAWSLSGGPVLSLSEQTGGLERPSHRLSRSPFGLAAGGVLQELQVRGIGRAITLTGHVQLGERGGWCQGVLQLEDGIDCVFLRLESFVQLGPSRFALHELPGVPAELLEGSIPELNRLRLRPVPMLRKAARAEGVVIPVQPGPFRVTASVSNTLLRVEGERLETDSFHAEMPPVQDGPLSRALWEELHALLTAEDWDEYRTVLRSLEQHSESWQKAFELLVLHCRSLEPGELRLARRLAATGSPAQVAALVAALRRAGENLRAAWWLRRLAQLQESIPLGRAALRAAEALEAQEGGLAAPSYTDLPALMVREATADRFRLLETDREGPGATDASPVRASVQGANPPAGLPDSSIEREAPSARAGSRPADPPLGTSVSTLASSPTSSQPPALSARMALGSALGGLSTPRPDAAPLREPAWLEHVLRSTPPPSTTPSSTPPSSMAPSSTSSRSHGSKVGGPQLPVAEPSSGMAPQEGSPKLNLDKLRAQYEAAEDWRGLLSALETLLEQASDADERLRIHVELARVKLGLGVPSRAVPHFEAVLQLSPGHSEAISFLRSHYQKEGQHVPRITLEARLVKGLEPREGARALVRLADEAERLHLLELTRSLLTDATALDPADVSLLERLTSMLEPLEAWEPLVVAWRRHLPLVASSKDKISVGLRIARYLLRQGDLGGAERLFRGVLRSDIEQPEAIEGLAEVLEARGAWAEVAELWQRRSRQLQGFERMTAALKLSELFARSLNDPEASDAWFQEAMIEAPRDSRSLNVILKHLAAKGDWKSLARFLEQRWETADTPADRHELLLHLGDVYLVRLQDPASARTCFQKAEALARTHRLSV